MGADMMVVIAGLCNSYSSYVTTFEEYQEQRYEGASTIFGPHTLDAYLQEFAKLAEAMVAGNTVPDGPRPPDLSNKQVSFLPVVILDMTPWGTYFGDVVQDCDVAPEYTVGPLSFSFPARELITMISVMACCSCSKHSLVRCR